MALYTIAVQDQALASATTLTLLQLRTGATKTAKVREWSISFDGVTASNAPVKVELLRYTSSGTGSAYTPNRFNPGDPAAISSAATGFTGEPSAASTDWIMYPLRLTPNGGAFVMQYAPDSCPVVPVSSWLGIRCTAPNAVNATCHLVFEE